MRYVFVTYNVKEGCGESLVKEFLASDAVKAIRKEEGCRKYEYFVSPECRDHVVLHEIWENQSCHEAHLAGPNMAPLGEMKGRYVTGQRIDVIDRE